MNQIMSQIKVVFADGLKHSDEEYEAYRKHAEEKYPNATKVSISFEGDEALLDYTIPGRPFERIRRITGYLVGTLDRFNDAKRAEEKDRIIHDL